ncbi:MAG: DUF1610 domain-containing protein [Methanobacteriota archaeon]|nr:MAG: DUF1610 domain-containing protein [Euryarchaeota archaeon]
MSSNITLDHCYSCNRELAPSDVGSSKFKCPECGANIIRCASCRRVGNKYACVSCGFEGP